LSSPADIVIGGASAGVGKTFCLLLEPLKHITNTRDFGGVIFRRTTPQIKNQGGLWDSSRKLYSKIDIATGRDSTSDWFFTGSDKNGKFTNSLNFNHMEYEKNMYDYQGSEIPFIAFDELTHFTKEMFFYMLSRNRTMCGVKPYVRCTCNPDPDSWVAEFISWWIGEDGFPMPERDGVIRYFFKDGENIIWGNTKEEVYNECKVIIDTIAMNTGHKWETFIKSLTFISGSIYDNKKLMETNPEYVSNLYAQNEVEKQRLLHGNWKQAPDASQLYNFDAVASMFTNKPKTEGQRCITADIALKGSNKLIILAWIGKHLVDIRIMDKSDGAQVIGEIIKMAVKWRVPNTSIVYDADGVGGFVDGFINGAVPFHGGGKAKRVRDKTSGKMIHENYNNLKTQCFYRSADSVNRGEYSICPTVGAAIYEKYTTVKQQILKERKAIKRDKADYDGKLRIIDKHEMKEILQGDSPDIMDAFMMREYVDLARKVQIFG
jgi:hypothetical protein